MCVCVCVCVDDQSRVVLSLSTTDSDSDYINASIIQVRTASFVLSLHPHLYGGSLLQIKHFFFKERKVCKSKI